LPGVHFIVTLSLYIYGLSLKTHLVLSHSVEDF
jgi:hypothetical protein